MFQSNDVYHFLHLAFQLELEKHQGPNCQL